MAPVRRRAPIAIASAVSLLTGPNSSQSLRLDAQQVHFRAFLIGDEAADEIIRTAGHGRDALGQACRPCAFGHARVALPLAQQFADCHFQRIAVARVDAVAQQQFDRPADFGQQRRRLRFRLAAGAQMDLDVAVGARMVVTGFLYFL